MSTHPSDSQPTRRQRGEVHLGALAACAAVSLAAVSCGEALIDSVVACVEAALQFLTRLSDPEVWFRGVGR